MNTEQELQAWIKKATEAAEERCERELEELRRETEDMKEDLARVNARNRREPPRIQHAVQMASKHSKVPDTALPSGSGSVD